MEKPTFDLNELAGGVAVITGGGSGLGLALAMESAEKRMHVVISDIREKEGVAAAKSLQELYPNLHCTFFCCDVTKIESVRSLLQFTKKTYPGRYIQFVAANAGVMLPKSTVLSGTYDEWKNTYNVNVLGVFNTVRVFSPVLLNSPVKSAIEITASMAGLIPGIVGAYGSSKLAAVGIAEALETELSIANTNNIGQVSCVVLCPGIVQTSLLDSSSENLPTDATTENRYDMFSEMTQEMFEEKWNEGMAPSFCAKKLFEHLRDGKFYCILNLSSETDSEVEAQITARYKAMMSRKRTAML